MWKKYFFIKKFPYLKSGELENISVNFLIQINIYDDN